MALPLYLAMTGAEMRSAAAMPEKAAWMACHFSPYSTGLSNFPTALPKGSTIIVNDRTPPCGHDPALIAAQLQQLAEDWEADGVLLDFQRPGGEETAAIAKAVTDLLTCPVGVSEPYAEALACPVFLAPAPLHLPLSSHLDRWKGRILWLDAALDAAVITVDANGRRFMPLFPPETGKDGFEEIKLHCRYRIKPEKDCVQFTLWRTEECLHSLLRQAEALGVSRAFGLYQQLGYKNPTD